MNESDEDPNLVANTLVESDQMEKIQNYLERGRRFEGLTTDQLGDKWVTSLESIRDHIGF